MEQFQAWLGRSVKRAKPAPALVPAMGSTAHAG
jgi:hypothetical protein